MKHVVHVKQNCTWLEAIIFIPVGLGGSVTYTTMLMVCARAT